MSTRVILICGDGGDVAKHMALAKLLKQAGELDCVDKIIVEINSHSTCSNNPSNVDMSCHAPNGRSFDDIYVDEIDDFYGRLKESMYKDEIKDRQRRYIDPPRDVPHVDFNIGKPIKSKAKPHRPMIRRTC